MRSKEESEDYRYFQDHVGELDAYLAEVAAANAAGLSPSHLKAFLINAYNAWTIEQVNAHEERESIRNINKTLGLLPLKGPWSEEMVRAAGRTLSLDDVELEGLTTTLAGAGEAVEERRDEGVGA